MAEGKIRAAKRLLDNSGDDRAGVPLGPNDIMETSIHQHNLVSLQLSFHLQTKLYPFTLCCLIQSKTKGSHGPSGLDAAAWRRMCCSFKGPSNELCGAVAKVAVRLASGPLDPRPIQAFTASHLVALNKCPGVRPIGVGEVSRRIMGKAILSVISEDIQQVASTYQLCAGQKGGCEAAVHAMRNFLECDDTEGLLIVDATNALNREAALRNIQVLCPSLANVVLNTYRLPPSLYIYQW